MNEINNQIGEDGIGTYIRLTPESGIWYNDNMVLAMMLAIVSTLENILPQETQFSNQFAVIAETLYGKIKETSQLDQTEGNAGSVNG